MKPEENTNIIDRNENGGGGKKSLKPIIIGAVVAVVIFAVAVVVVMSSFNSGDSADVYQPTAEDREQLKYDAEQQAREQRQADHIRDQNFIMRESDSASSNSLLKALDINKPQPPPESQQVQKEEEAINNVLRNTPPAAKSTVAQEAPRPPQTTQETSASSNSGNMPPMFVYSRSFGGAKYTEPKTGAQPSTTNQLDDITRAALGLLASSPQESATASDRTESLPVAEKKTQLLYTGLTPVTVHEGEMLEAVLVNRLLVDTEPSPVICHLSRDLFDASGQFVIFPANSRVIGSSQTVSYKGASRLFISFHRIILPNGMSVDLPQSQKMMKAMDETGAIGIVSHVNRHWMMQFGAAVMLGVIDGIAGYAQRNQEIMTADGMVISRASENFDRVLDRVMSQYSSIVPTIRVDQGKTLRIYISDDMVVSPYSRISERSYYAKP